jgi:hypothetical protein
MDHTPHWGQMRDFFVEKMKTILESMVKGMLRTKVQRLRKG